MAHTPRPTYCVNGLDAQFNADYVREEVKSYKKDGLGERAKRVLEFLCRQGLTGRSVLDVGCGIGALHLEILKAGAASAVGIDASSASIEAARKLAEEMGLADRAEYRLGDFTAIEMEIAAASVVVLDRVICCYPNMEALVGGAARHAQAFCGLTYPRRGWWMRAILWSGNLCQALFRSPYRGYYHDPRKVAALLATYGFTEVYRETASMWEVAVFKKEAVPSGPR